MKQYELHPLEQYVVYVICFDDDRIKVGVTSNIKKRIPYYSQEAKRNRVNGLTWWACKPLPKSLAFLIEKHFCRANKKLSIESHREWFEGDAKFYLSVITAIEALRLQCADILNEEPMDLPFQGSYGRVNAWGAV